MGFYCAVLSNENSIHQACSFSNAEPMVLGSALAEIHQSFSETNKIGPGAIRSSSTLLRPCFGLTNENRSPHETTVVCLILNGLTEGNLASRATPTDHAAAGGHLETVKWLHENRREGCTRYALTDAAGNGHMETVQWLHRNREEGCGRRAMVSVSIPHFGL